MTVNVKIGFVSLGCPKNLVDGEVMLGLAQQAGHEITLDAERRRRARREHVRVHRSRQAGIDRRDPRDGAAEARRPLLAPGRHRLPGRALSRRAHARRSPRSTRCSEPAKCRRSSDALEVRTEDRGPRVRQAVAAGLSSLQAPATRRPRPPSLGTRTSSAPDLSLRRRHAAAADDAAHFAYIKVAEGCDYTCAFCIIPTLRGQYRSRTQRVDRARGAGARGARRHASCCSSRRTRRSTASTAASAARWRVCSAQLNAIDGLEWIRLLYLYPTTITDDVLDAMAECEKVCRYVDLPLQHASADVLKRMRRPGNRKTYDTLLARIRDARSRRHIENDLHRRLSRRDRGRSSPSSRPSSKTPGSTTSACSPTRTRKARARIAVDDDVPAAVKRRGASG